MIRFRKYQPAPILAQYIQSYFIAEFDAKAEAPAPDDFMTNHPQGTVDFMFALRGGVKMRNYKKNTFAFSKIFVMAQQEGFFDVQFSKDACIVGVVFFPESFAKLFNFPLEEIKSGGRSLDDEVSEVYQVLYERLQEALTDQQRVLLLNEFIERQLQDVDFSFTKFDQLIKAIRLDGGGISIADLAKESNLSERTLQRNMKSLIGLTPKSYSNVMRFKKALEFIHANPTIDWQDTLYACGYYDQAHFIKDFKKYTNKTPRAFVKGDGELSRLFMGEKKTPPADADGASQ